MAICYDLTKRTGGGGNTYKLTSYTTATADTINNIINAANIPVATPNEIMLWNIKGTGVQTSGTVGVKMGFVVVQNGEQVANGGAAKRSSSIAAPDSMTPSTANPTNNTVPRVENGYYVVPAGAGVAFFVGAGNTVDFIQIPYNIGWATS